MLHMQYKDWSLREGDSLELMNKLAPDSIDGVVTDPPYCSGGRTSSERQAPPSKKYQTTGSKAYPEFLGDHRDQRVAHEPRSGQPLLDLHGLLDEHSLRAVAAATARPLLVAA